MKRTAFLFPFFFLLLQAHAQDDHLEPRGTYGIYESPLFNYFTNDLFLYLERSDDDTLLRFMMVPDTLPERAFAIRKNSDGYFIDVNRMYVNHLHSREHNKDVAYGGYAIDSAFAMKLTALYQAALERTDYPAVKQMSHNGTLYLFTAKDTSGTVRYAEKWSTATGRDMKELIAISEAVIEVNNHSERDIYKKLEPRIDSLTKRLQSTPPLRDPKNNAIDYYTTYYELNKTHDTITSAMTGKIFTAAITKPTGNEVLLREYYIKDAGGSWKNISTGEQHVSFRFGTNYTTTLSKRQLKSGKAIRATKIESRWEPANTDAKTITRSK